jgi:SAM-dependent methyltransferase
MTSRVPASGRTGLRRTPAEQWAAGRAWLYDRTFCNLTVGWYRAAFERFTDGARVLDVGIGTGGALIRCADLLVSKDLHVVGLDVDDAYLARCRSELAAAGLTDRVVALREPVEVHAGGPYEAAYFGASLMVLPAP